MQIHIMWGIAYFPLSGNFIPKLNLIMLLVDFTFFHIITPYYNYYRSHHYDLIVIRISRPHHNSREVWVQLYPSLGILALGLMHVSLCWDLWIEASSSSVRIWYSTLTHVIQASWKADLKSLPNSNQTLNPKHWKSNITTPLVSTIIAILPKFWHHTLQPHIHGTINPTKHQVR